MTLKIGNNYQNKINIIRLIENRLISSKLNVYFEFEFNDDYDGELQTSTIIKMKKWIELIVDGCLAFNTSSTISMSTIEKIQNHIMFCPDDPYDFMLSLLIYSKLNSIGSNIVDVTKLQISSDLGESFGNWIEGDITGVLPSLEEWVGERSYYDKPWWQRSDGGMIDMWAGPDDDISIKPDILIDLDSDLGYDIDNEPAEIIKPNFKPTIIKND